MFKALDWNVGHNNHKETHEAIRDLITRVDLGVFNEMADQSLPDVKGYRGLQPDDVPGLNRNPVMWRTDKFEFLGYDFKLVVPQTYVGPAGAGPNELTNKYRFRVKLKDRETKKRLDVFPVHAAPSLYIPKRRALHVRHMKGIRTGVVASRALKRQTLVLGDFNEDFRHGTIADKYIPGRSNHDWLRPVGTHGERAIDAQIGAGIRAINQQLLSKHGSDHSPLVVEWK